MACRTGCPTQDHGSYAACLRGSGIRVAYANSTNGWDYTRQKRFDRENAAYRQAVADGLQPTGFTEREIGEAYQHAEVAYANGYDTYKKTLESMRPVQEVDPL